MKRRIILLAASALALVSCGSAKQFADASQNQQFRDEVYYNPKGSGADRQAQTIAKVEEDLLVKKTKESPIFMKSGEKVDTLFIPEGKNARIEFDKEGSTTSVFVTDSGWETWYAYQPWYARTWYTPFHSSLYWGANPWYYAGWYDPWYYGRWYDPWYFGAGWSFGWYDPWYCGGWYDPWFYGWYNPWHHCGWYDPWYYGHAHIHYPGHGGPGWYGGARVYTSRTAANGSTVRSGNGSDSRKAGSRNN